MSDKDDMSVGEAMKHIADALHNFDNQSPEQQALLRGFLHEFKEQIGLQETREKELKYAKQARKRQTAAERKKYRDKVIPEWCEENLKPGMIVKVKAANSRLRQIESITPSRTTDRGYVFPGHLTGRHVHYSRRRNPETNEFTSELKQDGYITDHTLTNVQGVVTGTDKRGHAIVVPIMELVEGTQNLKDE